LAASLLLNATIFPDQAFIGHTERVEAQTVYSAGVDSRQPDTPTSSLEVASEGRYVYVKIDLSTLPSINEILIISARLSFRFGGWKASGEWGYASVATHYCGDDSWTNNTLTWRNKPAFQQEATDHWGFSFIYVGEPYLDFSIEEDIVTTLEAGDKILTEVITWGSGTGETTISRPKLTIEYARRPVYNVRLDVLSTPDVDISKTPIVRIKIDGQTFGEEMALIVSERPLFPKSEYASPGNYSLEFRGRCKFSSWETSGGVSVSDPDSPITQLTIGSDGGLVAKCSLDWVIYGDEIDYPPSTGIHESFKASERYAEKYKPLISGYLRLVRIYVFEDPEPFELHILGMTEDPTKDPPLEMASPVRVTPRDEGWTQVDLTSQKIWLEKDQTYYISITWLTEGKPVFASEISPTRDVYRLRDNVWSTFYEGIVTQHMVSISLEEPVKFLGISTSLLCNVSLPKIMEGDSLNVVGRIYPGGPQFNSKTVTLTFKRPDGSTFNRTITTEPFGEYEYSYKPDAPGSWSVTASWNGDNLYDGSVSLPVFFTVEAEEASAPLLEAIIGGAVLIIIGAIAYGVYRALKRRKQL